MNKEELKKIIAETSKKASEEAKEKGLSKEDTKKYVAEKIAIVRKSNPIIEEEKTIKVRVPISELNPEDKEIIVGINGMYAKIIRGEETEVSIPVYEQLRNAGLV